jgi:hypothetical protein
MQLDPRHEGRRECPPAAFALSTGGLLPPTGNIEGITLILQEQ